jgi:glycosyltransferase involved in cell wall biosynthesis
MNSPKISIIVPVYNDQDRIGRAIKSALEQTIKEIELIVIDDGSSDRTPEILAEYAQQDKRIIVLQGNRGGAYICRSLGIARASGTFVGFLDSDDWIEASMYESMFRACEQVKADLAICSSKRFLEDSETYLPHVDFFGWPNVVHINETNIDKINGGLCNKIYRRSCIIEKNLSFGNYRIAADTAFNWQYYLEFPRAAIVPEEHYIYTLRGNSLVTKPQGRVSLNVIDVFFDIKSLLISKGLFKQYRSAFYRYITPHLIQRTRREGKQAFPFVKAAFTSFGFDYLLWNITHLDYYFSKLWGRISKSLR